MNKFFLICLIVILSCKNDEVKYYNHDKWQIPGGYNYSSLKDKPKEVKESLYLDLNDTALNATGKFNNYDLWRFDNYGNIVYHKYSTDIDSFFIVTKTIYDRNGYQSKIYTNKDSLKSYEDGGKVVSKSINKNKFLQKSFYVSDQPKYSLITFLNDGNIVRNQSLYDTNNLNRIRTTKIEYYANDFLQKIEMTSSDGHQQFQKYYYSKENFLDSVTTSAEAKLLSKEIYFNNKNGDPIKYFEIDSNNDTSTIVWMQYEYDQHGNWIRQLEKTIDKNNYSLILGDTVPKCSLIIREIKY